MKTTLNKIRGHLPCCEGWAKLLKNLGKTKADDEPVSIAYILESNGIDDALWCLRAVDGYQREMRLFAVDCARSVQHLTNDARSIDAIDVAERYANGRASDGELDAARAAAWGAGGGAVRGAGGGAARGAAWGAARGAAWGAALDAARAAAWDVAWDVQSNLLALMCAEIEQREGQPL